MTAARNTARRNSGAAPASRQPGRQQAARSGRPAGPGSSRRPRQQGPARRAGGRGPAAPRRILTKPVVVISVVAAVFITVADPLRPPGHGLAWPHLVWWAVFLLLAFALAATVIEVVTRRSTWRRGWSAASRGKRRRGRARRPVQPRRADLPLEADEFPADILLPAADPYAMLPPGPWLLRITSRSGRQISGGPASQDGEERGYPVTVIPVTDRGDLVARMEAAGQDPDLAAEVATVPGMLAADLEAAPDEPGAEDPTGPLPVIQIAASGGIPPEWAALVRRVRDVEFANDRHFLDWTRGQRAGMTAYAEAIISAYETATSRRLGLNPRALQGLKSFADAVTEAARLMMLARRKFALWYRDVRKAAREGKLADFEGPGSWWTGQGDEHLSD